VSKSFRYFNGRCALHLRIFLLTLSHVAEIFKTNTENGKDLKSSNRKVNATTSSKIINVEQNSQPVGNGNKKSCSCSSGK
jgi:hypothetical protein